MNWSNISKVLSLKELFPQYSESDLAKCLARYGNNVTIAAEQLLVGNFTTSITSSTSTSTSTSSTSMTSGQASKKTNVKHNKADSSKQEISSVSCLDAPSKHSNFASTVTATAATVTAASAAGTRTITTQQEFIQPQRDPSYQDDLFDEDEEDKRQWNKMMLEFQDFLSDGQPVSYDSYCNPKDRKLLLCERYAMGCCTSRKGKIQTSETITFTTSSTTDHRKGKTHHSASSIVRFQAKEVQGTLEKALGHLFSPLLRHGYILLQGEVVSEDLHVMIGRDILMKVRVYIVGDPMLLFQASPSIQKNNPNDTALSSTPLYQNTTQQALQKWKQALQSNTNKGKQQQQQQGHGEGGVGVISLPTTVFAFLQWAEYGTISTCFNIKENDYSKDTKEDTSSRIHCSSKNNSTTSIIQESNEKTKRRMMIPSNDNSTNKQKKRIKNDSKISKMEEREQGEEEEDNNEDEEEEEEEEEENIDEAKEITIDGAILKTNEMLLDPLLSFAGPDGGGDDGKKSSFLENTVSCDPVYEEDPLALRQKGINLLPHQKYALHWMMQREQWCYQHDNQHPKDVNDNDDTKQQVQDFIPGNEPKNLDHHNMEIVQKIILPWKKSVQVNPLDLEILRQVIQSPQCAQDSISSVSPSSCFLTSGNDVSCDIGPVRVSEGISAFAKTLDKVEDPIIDHILWKKRFLWDKSDKRVTNKVYCFYVNEIMNQVSIASPTLLKQAVGGILADEMGLGKTIMILSLIAKVKELEFQIALLSSSEEPSTVNSIGGPTLIVAPLSMLPQWQDEIESKTTMSVYTYYNQSKREVIDLSSYDIALTTYGTLQSEFSSNTKNGHISSKIRPLFDMHWKRIILDEAHLIKNSNTAVSKASFALNADARWCLTGTPLQNSLDDIYSLLRFIRHEPWSEISFWKRLCPSRDMNNASADAITHNMSLDRLKMVLSPLILRRTKHSLSSQGSRLLNLPAIDFQTISVRFTEPERVFYEALRTKSQSIFLMYVDAGVATKSWFQIFSLLQRLRQACDHMALTAPSRSESLSDGEFENLPLPSVTVEECTDADFVNLDRSNRAYVVATPFIEEAKDSFKVVEDAPSAKLQAILNELEKVWTNHPNCKVLIFSQYLGFLDLLEKPLKSCHVQTFRLVGSMSMTARSEALDSFAKAKGRKVVLPNYQNESKW